MSNQEALVPFLRSLVAAKKSVAIYPPTSETAAMWIERLRRALDSGFRQGLIFPIRVGRDRFSWAGGELLTKDATLDGLRFELRSRGIAEISIDPSVENWELQAMLELLNQPAEQFTSVTTAQRYLRDRAVVCVNFGAPGLAGSPALPGQAGTDGLAGAEEAGPGGVLYRTDMDALDRLVESVLELVDERFERLAYDRTGLLQWFQTISCDGRVDLLYTAVSMLAAMAASSGEREVHARTTLEALMLLPDATLTPFFTDWLLPRAGSDLKAFNLLTQVTEDELRQIAHRVPRERLVALTTELLEYPWEEGQRLRLLEAITAMLERGAEPGRSPAGAVLLSDEDPLLLDLRQEIIDACRPAVLLAHSADVLLALVATMHPGEYPAFAADALADVAREALAGNQPELALRILRGVATDALPALSDESPPATTLVRRKLAGRTHVALIVGLLRRDQAIDPIDAVTEYLRLAGPESVQAFTAILADEAQRRVRLRMCEALARVGVPAIPTLLPWLGDKRWYVVRNVLYTLRKIGHASAFPAVVAVLEHPHPRVRLEAVRVAIQTGGITAGAPVLQRVHDPDRSVQRATISAIGVPGNDHGVPELRKVLLGSAALREDDADIQIDTIRALAAIGTPAALDVLETAVRRRIWFWRRAERRIRDVAAQTLRGQKPPEPVAAEAVHGR